MRLCPQGHLVDVPDARFCATCGASMEAPPPAAVCATHLDRAAAGPCSRCGTFGCEECLVWVGPQRLCPSCRAREEQQKLPWDERERLGTWRAYFETTKALMFSPARAAAQASPTGTLGSSLLFGVISQTASILTTALLYGLGAGAIGAAFIGETSKLSPLTMLGLGAAVAVGTVLFTVFTGTAWLLIGAALDHLVLNLVGARPRSFDVTLRACALSLSPSIWGLVPICGLYVIPVWTVALKVVLYKSFHRTTAGRAVLGGLLVPGLMVLLAISAYVAVIMFAARAQAAQ